jgi:nucleotide-binding universal stress UspA family protein
MVAPSLRSHRGTIGLGRLIALIDWIAEMFKKILLAYDRPEHSAGALRQAADLARLFNAELHLLGVVTTNGSAALTETFGTTDFFGMERTAIEEALKTAIDDFGENMSVHTRIREGDPAEEIATYAHEIGADLVVIGHINKGFLSRLFEGTGAKLIRNLPCNLLISTAG